MQPHHLPGPGSSCPERLPGAHLPNQGSHFAAFRAARSKTPAQPWSSSCPWSGLSVEAAVPLVDFPQAGRLSFRPQHCPDQAGRVPHLRGWREASQQPQTQTPLQGLCDAWEQASRRRRRRTESPGPWGPFRFHLRGAPAPAAGWAWQDPAGGSCFCAQEGRRGQPRRRGGRRERDGSRCWIPFLQTPRKSGSAGALGASHAAPSWANCPSAVEAGRSHPRASPGLQPCPNRGRKRRRL